MSNQTQREPLSLAKESLQAASVGNGAPDDRRSDE
jgi:hypothetical protein